MASIRDRAASAIIGKYRITASTMKEPSVMRAMSPHEKECAIAAIVSLIERAKSRAERTDLKRFLREIDAAPLARD